MVVLAAFAEQAVAAGLNRFDGDPVAHREILDAGADLDDVTAKLMSHDHGIDHAGQGMRFGGPGGDRPVVVFVQVTATNAVVEHPQLDMSGSGDRFGDILQTQILASVINRSAHAFLQPRTLRGRQSYAGSAGPSSQPSGICRLKLRSFSDSRRIGTRGTFQVSSAYSRMVRSEEKPSERATLSTDISDQ
jgi:hypothetical protein